MTSRNPSDHGSSSSEDEGSGQGLLNLFTIVDEHDHDDQEETSDEGDQGNINRPRQTSDGTRDTSLVPDLLQALFLPLGLRPRPLPPASRPSAGTIQAPQNFRRSRVALPSHYLLKIESFSSFSKASIENYHSEFGAGGYKWELSIYPNGDKKNGGQDHVSFSLRLLDTNSLPVGWEVNIIFSFFVFDQIRDQYVTFPDVRVLRYHSMKTKWGVPKFIDLRTFNDPSNGYLVNDTCTFGGEVYVIKNTFKGECLSMIEEPITCVHTWKVDSFSSKTLERYESELFVGGDYKWRILLYPNGFGEGKGNSLSLFLQLDMSTLPLNTKLFVSYILRVRHQISTGKHIEQTANNLFWSSAGWGFRQFISLAKFKHPENGFLVGDTCIIEAQFKVLGLIKQD